MSWLLDPRLADCRRIFLRNYVVDANIGIHEHEKRGAQRLALNVDLFVALSMSTPRHDKLLEVVDYDFVRLTIKHRIDQGHVIAMAQLGQAKQQFRGEEGRDVFQHD